MTALEARLRAQGLSPAAWSNGPGDHYSSHRHPWDKVIVCASGSITFGLPATGETIGLAPGDRLELPAGTDHDAAVGPAGVACLEAHVPAGSLDRVQRRPAGGW
jgi:quercetin dioxygenase-like cupin family protein